MNIFNYLEQLTFAIPDVETTLRMSALVIGGFLTAGTCRVLYTTLIKKSGDNYQVEFDPSVDEETRTKVLSLISYLNRNKGSYLPVEVANALAEGQVKVLDEITRDIQERDQTPLIQKISNFISGVSDSGLQVSTIRADRDTY